MSVFVSLSLGLEEIFIIITVSCLASSAIPNSTYTRIHIDVLEKSEYGESLKSREILNTLWTGDADSRLYITTVQDG